MSADPGQRFADVPPERLAALYERHDGTVADELGCSWTWARNRLERHGIHESEPGPATRLAKLGPDALEEGDGGEGG